MLPNGPNPLVQKAPPHCRAAPLVLVHDGGGTVFGYFTLGSLNRAVWAIFNPKFFQGQTWAGGVDEMARHYIGLLSAAGFGGTILLGGWSLGAYISLAMARMLADDPSASVSVAGLLIIEVPYHTARSKRTVPTSVLQIDRGPEPVRTSFSHAVQMLERWDLPPWHGPAGRDQDAHLRVAGQDVPLPRGSVLYKPLGRGWGSITTTRQLPHPPSLAKDAVLPPPAVMIRAVHAIPKAQWSGPEPPAIDLHRDEALLGWDRYYADFLAAVADVDDNHCTIFDDVGGKKTQTLTQHINACLEILDSVSRSASEGPSSTRDWAA